MKFHRVLLFTSLQMDITPVGEDLHVLLTSDGAPYIGCTAHAFPADPEDDPEDLFDDLEGPGLGSDMEGMEGMEGTDDKLITFPDGSRASDPEITIISSDESPEKYFTIYVADQLARKTGQSVLCTGGIFVEDPDEYQLNKLYENIDEMIMDWVNFLSD